MFNRSTNLQQQIFINKYEDESAYKGSGGFSKFILTTKKAWKRRIYACKYILM